MARGFIDGGTLRRMMFAPEPEGIFEQVVAERGAKRVVTVKFLPGGGALDQCVKGFRQQNVGFNYGLRGPSAGIGQYRGLRLA